MADINQGSQYGSGNVQNNFFQGTPPSILITLNPHEAAARLRLMRREEAISAIAIAPPVFAAEALKVMLKADEERAVALLADANPFATQELIGLLQGTAPWLEALPAASEAIRSLAAELGWGHDGSAGDIERATVDPGKTEGYVRKYASGLICFTGKLGANSVSGPVAEVYTSKGRARALGFPMDEEKEVPPSPQGAIGTRQLFEHGSVFSSVRGAYRVYGSVKRKHDDLGMSGGWLGFPISGTDYKDGYRKQFFEGGAIFSVAEGGTFAIRQDILERVKDGQIPIASEVEAASPPPFSTGGVTQRFGSGWDELICWSAAHGAYTVDSRITLEYYESLGGVDSWLGFPIEKMISWVQTFEGGAIYEDHDNSVAFAVPTESLILIANENGGIYLDAAGRCPRRSPSVLTSATASSSSKPQS